MAEGEVETDGFDREALADRISDEFASVMATADEPEPTAGEPEPVVDGDPSPAPAATDETPVEETPAESEETEGQPEAETTPKKPVSILPAAYRRTLKGYEWTDEEIAAAEAVDPQKFLLTARKMHETRNKEVTEWSTLGQQLKKQLAEEAAKNPAKPREALKTVDAAVLKAKYGEELLIDALVGPVNATIEQLKQVLPQVQAYQEQAQKAQAETLGRQVESFFGGKEMKAYDELYGKAGTTPTDAQWGKRTEVLEFADALMHGAHQQKRSLSLDDALQLAHDSMTGEQKKQAAREEIVDTLQTRQRGISVRPTGRKPAAKPNSKTARTDLERKVAGGLAKAFASSGA